MNTETETGFWRESRRNIRPAPSLRVPVTAANRELLRRLRAAESFAWESGRAATAAMAGAIAGHVLTATTDTL